MNTIKAGYKYETNYYIYGNHREEKNTKKIELRKCSIQGKNESVTGRN